MTRRAIYPGSFDPPTYGHIDIIRRSLQIVDEVVVAVVYNPQKDTFLFTPQERIDMFREELKDVDTRINMTTFTDCSLTMSTKRMPLLLFVD